MGTATYDGEALAGIRRAGKVSAETLASLGARVVAGVTTAQLASWAAEEMTRRGGRSSVLGVNGFPDHICTSRNAVVCNGLPGAQEVLQPGDVISLDVAVEIAGYHANVAATFTVGAAAPEVRALVCASEDCLAAAISAVQPGGRLGDVSAAISACAQAAGFCVIADFGGHGIGKAHLEDPFVANVAKPGTGIRLRPGMVFTIEPMLTTGAPVIEVLPDGWSAATRDGQPSAHCKHTVCVTTTGCEVLTRMRWSIFADLSRALTDAERGGLFAALDEIVPGSGCIGPNRRGVEEVYFSVEAETAEAARLAAARFMDRTISAAGVAVGYEITVQ